MPPLLQCVLSNEFSNGLPERIHNHTGYICLTFLHCAFSNWPIIEEDRLTAKDNLFISCWGSGRCLPFLVDVGGRLFFGCCLTCSIWCWWSIWWWWWCGQCGDCDQSWFLIHQLNSVNSCTHHQSPSLLTGGTSVNYWRACPDNSL